MIKLKLIDNWRNCWQFSSVQIAAALAILDASYEYLPAIQSYVPEGWVKWAALSIIVARIIKQSSIIKVTEPPES